MPRPFPFGGTAPLERKKSRLLIINLGNISNLIMQVELESRILRAKKYIALTWPLKKSSSIYRSKRIQNDEKDC